MLAVLFIRIDTARETAREVPKPKGRKLMFA